MKTLVSIAFFILFSMAMNAQTQFGITAGLIYAEGEGRYDDQTASRSETGFFGGGVVDFTLTDKLHIQPELLFAVSDEGGAMFIPIMAKYYVFPSINIQAGPQIDYTFEQVPDNFTSLGIAIAVGAGYDLTEKFFLEAKYSFQLNDYYTGNLDASATVNNLLVGLGYRFN